jgi:hypothetical protein
MDNSSKSNACSQCSQAYQKILLQNFIFPEFELYPLYLVHSNSLAQTLWLPPDKNCGRCQRIWFKTCVDSFLVRISMRNILHSIRVFLKQWEAPKSYAVFLSHEIAIILSCGKHNPHEHLLIHLAKSPPKIFWGMCCFTGEVVEARQT